MSQLTFQAVTLIPVSHNNQTYITSSDLARALQYARTDSISRIYERNSDEFTADMTTTVNLTVVRETGNVEMDQRIFSLRGAHLIAMFARTPVAKEFRKWVLDILDKEVLQNSQQNLPLVEEKKYTLELTEYELRKLCWLWKMAEIMRSLLYILYEPLNALGSRHSGAAYGYSREYQFSIEESRKILLRATKDIQPHKFDADWNRVLPELRKGKVNNY